MDNTKTGIRAWVIVAFVATMVAATWYGLSEKPHSANNDPIYKSQLEAQKMMRDANAVPVRIVK